MKGGSRPLGYTIIEVMIVLAISGVMFVMAATFISGKQAKTSFTVGTNDLSSQVQSIISQVVNGSYSDVAITCSSNGGVTTVSVGGTGQGTNHDCVFLGKVIYFDNGAIGPDYQILSLAGARISSGAPNRTFTPSDVAPAVIGPLTTNHTVSQNLIVSRVTEDDPSGNTFTSSAIAFLQGLGSTDSTGQLNSGSQSVSLYYVKNVTPATGGNINNIIAGGANLLPAKDVKICVNDGSSQRYSQITIGLSDTDELTTSITGVSIC